MTINNDDFFKAHFMQGMENEDYESFKKMNPELFKCIMSCLNDLNPPLCPVCNEAFGYTSFAKGLMSCRNESCRQTFNIEEVLPGTILFKQ